MINNISSALDAYQQALGRINAGAAKIEGTGASQASSGAGFGDMVKAAVENTVDLNKFSEQMTVQGIQGKADILCRFNFLSLKKPRSIERGFCLFC